MFSNGKTFKLHQFSPLILTLSITFASTDMTSLHLTDERADLFHMRKLYEKPLLAFHL